MRKALASAAGLAVLAAMLGSGGCVSAQEFEKLRMMNRAANEELEKTKGRLRLAEEDNQKLQDQLADRDRTIEFQSTKIASLETANRTMRGELDAALRKIADLGNIPAPPPGPLPGVLNAALRKLATENPDLMEFDEKNGMVKLKSDLTFDKGSVEIKPQALAALKRLAEILNSAEAKLFNVYIAGHTDDIPLVQPETIREHKTNWGLSVHRAVAVVEALFNAGVEQVRMGALGFSKYHPTEPNAAGNKGNPANRRVEIWIVPPTLMLTRPASSSGT